ncbi:MAG: VWA domain-containing protein [Acidobacteriota bacterium]|nr:VWA domain-containing protein [Acidobacteriota bacterium]
MRTAASLLALALASAPSLAAPAPAPAQETQTVPGPVGPAPNPRAQQDPPPPTPQKPAPVERRNPHPNASAPEPVEGPLTQRRSGQAGASASPHPANPDDIGILRVQTRLVNIALNVVDSHGSPAAGFERGDFRIFEDGKPQTIAVFEREASSPLSIVLAIDASETVLTSDRLEREAAKRFIRATLRQQDELALMDFSDTVREIVPFTNQARRIEQGLTQIRRGDETALYDAVYLASDRLAQAAADPGRRRVLVLISDGGDTTHRSGYVQAIEEAQRAGAMIFSIIIVPVAADAGRNTGGEHALIQMSEDTGGKYYYVTDPADLEPAFRHVSEDLRTQYLLGYYAPRASGQNGFRRIQVKLQDPAAAETFSLRYRSGYYADAK